MSVPSNSQFLDFDVAVIGGGPVGLAAAISLAQGGARTALVARKVPYSDNRTTALLGDSVEFLQLIDVWGRCSDKAAALRVMRLVDDTESADPRARDAFFMRRNRHGRVRAQHRQSRPARGTGGARSRNPANAHRQRGRQCDQRRNVGGHSLPRRCQPFRASCGRRGRTQFALPGIGGDRDEVPGAPAIGPDLQRHASRPHGNVSTEFHTGHGPCVFVPLPGNRSSVVCVLPPHDAALLAKATTEELTAALEKRSHYHLGALVADDERHVFPLAFGQISKIADRRIALVGEAAHVLPPIGAQGLNLGLRDAETISRMALNAIAGGDDPGEFATLASYSKERQPDIAKRSLVVGMAHQSLLSDFLPAQMIRAAGMHVMNAAGPLRRFVMLQATGAGAARAAELTTDDVIAGRSIPS